jgi:hypothetical protein
MSRLFLASLLLYSTAFAQGVKVDITAVCYTKQTLEEKLKKFGEEPMIIGKRYLSGNETGVATVVYINRTTGSYTIVEMDSTASCVISMGTEVMYRYPKSQVM